MILRIESLETVFDREALLNFPLSRPSLPTQSAKWRIISNSAELPHLEKLIKLYDKQLLETKQAIAKLFEKEAVLKSKFDRCGL